MPCENKVTLLSLNNTMCRSTSTGFVASPITAMHHLEKQYLATDYECAVHETIFHDVPIDQPHKTVGIDNVKPLAHSLVKLKRDISLVPLFAPDLVARADLMDTTAAAYKVTAQWALAIHQSRPDADGLIWTSKRCDPQQALLLFGDRVSESDLIAVSRTPIYTSVDEMKHIVEFAGRIAIDLVL